MSRSLNLAVNPLRFLLLLLALALLGIVALGVNASQSALHTTGSRLSAPVLEPAQGVASQPALNAPGAPAAQAAQGTTRVITSAAPQQSTSSTAPAGSAPVQVAPAQGCQVNPAPGRGIPAVCANP